MLGDDFRAAIGNVRNETVPRQPTGPELELLRRLAANISILYPINTVRSVPHWVYRRFVGICLA
jgi:hypothetical protein